MPLNYFGMKITLLILSLAERDRIQLSVVKIQVPYVSKFRYCQCLSEPKIQPVQALTPESRIQVIHADFCKGGFGSDHGRS